MTRNAKIRFIKGYLVGAVTQADLKPNEIEVWFQKVGTSVFENVMNRIDIIDKETAMKKASNTSNIVVEFVSGKTIL